MTLSNGSKLGKVQLSTAKTYLEQGDALRQEGKWEEARECYQKVIELEPNNWLAHHHIGDCLINLDKWEASEKAYYCVLKYKDDFVWTYHNLGIAFVQQCKWDKAFEYFTKLTNLNKDFWKVNKVDFKVQKKLGDYLFEQERWDDAVIVYQRVIKLQPSFPWSYINLGRALQKLDRFNESLAALRRSVRVAPELSWGYYYLGQILCDAGAYEQAHQAYQKANELEPENQEMYQMLVRLQEKLHDSQIELDLNLNRRNGLKNKSNKSVLEEIEDYVNLDISQARRSLIHRTILDNFKVILEQMLLIQNNEMTEIDTSALLSCLAEIKADIYYLKTKIFPTPLEEVDPQMKEILEPSNIFITPKPAVIKTDLSSRIIGTGWYEPEEKGRWTGPTTASSIVLPYPSPGYYRFEMLVLNEAIPGLLSSLVVSVNEKPLEISFLNSDFPKVATSEILVKKEDDQPFLGLDITLDRTASSGNVSTEKADPRRLGIFVSSIHLIRSSVD